MNEWTKTGVFGGLALVVVMIAVISKPHIENVALNEMEGKLLFADKFDGENRDNAARLENRDSLNDELQGWLGQRDLEETMDQLIPSGGVVGPVYDAPQIMSDPHYQAREDIIDIDDPELGKTKMLGIVPKFSETPGAVEHAGPTIGEHNQRIYGSWLGLDEGELAEMTGQGTI